MALSIYNTLTRRKEEFVPLVEGRVGMYVCGPTVYGHSHIGHAKSYVSFDVIVRYLRYRGYVVTYVQNITDVGHLLGDTNEGEDRLLRQGRLEQKHPMEIAEAYTRSYFEDMDALGVLRPDIAPRATGHITEQIAMVQDLVAKGYAYEVNGSVYFDVSKDKEYGKLSGRSTDEVESGTRVGQRSEKRHPNDFALWKFAEPEHLMRWPSPWGIGFPGWHIECSAMSMKYLGETFDIHGGGMDNQFPHHECEIAQSECCNGVPFANGYVDYLKYVNAKGGLNGVKISYEECETGYDTARGVEGPGPDRAGPHGLLPPLQRDVLAFEQFGQALQRLSPATLFGESVIALLNPETHGPLLDDTLGASPLLQKVADAHATWREARAALDRHGRTGRAQGRTAGVAGRRAGLGKSRSTFVHHAGFRRTVRAPRLGARPRRMAAQRLDVGSVR